MSGHRRAAVALHGLQAADRQAMLSQLPEHDQQILQDYLAELDALGFSYGPDLAQEIPVRVDKGPAVDAVTQLRRMPLARLLPALADEPAMVIARVLQIQAWPWQENFLGQLPALLKQRVRGHLAQGLPPAPKLQACLLENLLRKIASQPPRRMNPAPQAVSWLANWRQRWSR